MSPSTQIVIVTGANRGIGHAIGKLAASTSQPTTLYACSRKGADLGIDGSSSCTVKYPSLDVASAESIASLAKTIKAEHGGCDVLINNAGVNLEDGADATSKKTTVEVNYRGTLNMCKTFLPLMRNHGRIVNVSSVGSITNGFPNKDFAARFKDSDLTLAKLDSLMQEYVRAAESGKDSSLGYPGAYCVTKRAINALTSILAREHPSILINCCCPGWVNTDMGNLVGSAPKTPEEGAKIPLRLAFKDIKEESGHYWSNPGVSDRGEGRVATW